VADMQITINDTRAREVLSAIAAATGSTGIRQVMGRSATNLIQRHLRDINQARPNRLGGRRENFYAKAADSTHFRDTPEGVTVSVTHTGFALRYYGGTVRPVNAKALAIPARPEAYGYSPREFADLFMVWKPGRAVGLLARRAGARLEVLYFLVSKATIPADPSLLPDHATIHAAVAKSLNSYFSRIAARQASPEQ